MRIIIKWYFYKVGNLKPKFTLQKNSFPNHCQFKVKAIKDAGNLQTQLLGSVAFTSNSSQSSTNVNTLPSIDICVSYSIYLNIWTCMYLHVRILYIVLLLSLSLLLLLLLLIRINMYHVCTYTNMYVYVYKYL
jgi:hypothetical protein